MKVLHISPTYFPAHGGAEMHALRISRGLASRGHQVTVLTANVLGSWALWRGESGGLPDKEIIDGVRVRRLQPDGGMVGSLFQTWQNLPGGYRSLMLAFGRDGVEMITRKPYLAGLIPYILMARPEIVATINWFWPVAYYVYLARKIKRFTLVGIPLLHVQEPWCSTTLHRRMLAACDGVITNTAFEANYVHQQADARTEAIGVGIEPREFECRDGYNLRMLYNLGSLPVVGYVGRFHPNKGVATLVRAMRVVWKSKPEVRLVLAGPRSTLDKEVVTLVQSLTGAERERIVWIYDFPEAHKASVYDVFDVFAMPSMAESFGITYLEAWMCGKPVIGARTEQTQCVIEHGLDGLLVKFGDPEDTARALMELLADGKKREDMGRRGRSKTVSQFTWDKVTDKVENFYLELITRPRDGKPSTGKPAAVSSKLEGTNP